VATVATEATGGRRRRHRKAGHRTDRVEIDLRPTITNDRRRQKIIDQIEENK
jgi:hypothetical protein